MRAIGSLFTSFGKTMLPVAERVGAGPIVKRLFSISDNYDDASAQPMVQQASARLPNSSAIVRLHQPVTDSLPDTISAAQSFQSDFNSILKREGYHPEADSELHLQLNEAQRYMRPDDLATFLDKVGRFNKSLCTLSESYPGQFLINLGAGRKIYWNDLRKCLDQFPQYFSLTEILGIPYVDSVNLLFSVIDAVKSRHTGFGREVMPQFIGILEAIINDSQEMGENLANFYAFLEVAQERGEICRALGTIKCSVNAGMPFHRALELVVYIYENATSEAHAFIALINEVYYLRTNDIDGEALFQAIMNISGDDPHYSQGNYGRLTQLLYIAATQTPHLQQDVVGKINAVAVENLLSDEGQRALTTTDGNKPDPLTVAANELALVSDDPSGVIVMAQKEPEIYFPQSRSDKLVHGIMPYRLGKSYGDGLKDLRGLMVNEFPEGAWVYDPQGQTWFSMGGKTSVSVGRVRAEFFPYDISQLSSNPVFIHIHPEAAETFIVPNSDSLVLPQFQKKITKFVASMPSVADFDLFASLLLESTERDTPLETIIVTSIGVTEIRFPNDAEQIRQFSKEFLEMKDNVLLEFDAHGYYQEHGIMGEDIAFVRTLTDQLNAKLPDGFQIIVYDFDEYMSSLGLQ